MVNQVLFVEGYNDIPDKIRAYLERGWTVYNAPRPLYGHETWTGDFRHGVLYAAVAPEGDPADEFGDAPMFHKCNQDLDGHICQIVTEADVMAYGAKVAEEYKRNLADFDYEDIVKSYVGWLRRQEA